MPKQVDKPAQRRAIAGAAIQVIHLGGLENARLRDVARAADVTTGAVMHYFENKDAVLEAALEEIVRRTLSRMDSAPPPGASLDPRAFIARVARYLPTDEAQRQEWRVWLAFWGRAMSEARLREVHERHYAQIVDRLATQLQRLRGPAPKTSRAQALRSADALIAAIDGVGTRATLEPARWPPKRQRETLSELLTPMLLNFVGDDSAPAPKRVRSARRPRSGGE